MEIYWRYYTDRTVIAMLISKFEAFHSNILLGTAYHGATVGASHGAVKVLTHAAQFDQELAMAGNKPVRERSIEDLTDDACRFWWISQQHGVDLANVLDLTLNNSAHNMPT
jgi:hypothetical protein